jgi:succinate-semialdehyde dehydrogenase/glutarate-semialdehyde dehydrogenase
MVRLKDRVESLRLGADRDHQVDIGALCTERQAVKVRQHIEDALAQGATIFAQADVPAESAAGNFLPAIVLADVSHRMAVMKEETFGPVLGVMEVANMEDALRLANDSMLGLTGSVWSRDTRSAQVLGRRIHAGVVTINDHLLSHGLAETPWGGVKESGIGRSHGRQGFDEMTETQVMVVERFHFLRRNLFWHPFSPALYDGLRGLLDLLYARGLGRRVRGLRKLLAIAPRMFKTRPQSDAHQRVSPIEPP